MVGMVRIIGLRMALESNVSSSFAWTEISLQNLRTLIELTEII